MRTTTTITLPTTGKKVEIIEYFTRGERIEIEKALVSKAKIDMVDGRQNLSFDPIASIEQREKTVLMAVKKIGDKTATQEMINELPEEDGAFLEEAVMNIGKDKKKPVMTSTESSD